jgi:hypothetical protein
MRCPNVQRCKVCDKLLIHKGSRQRHESSSYFGQIIHNLLPAKFSFVDIDAALYRRSVRLLRFFEHKSPGQHHKYAQLELLQLLARTIEHIKRCPEARKEFGLHPQSGVYLVEGDPHEGNRLGDCEVIRLCDGRLQRFDEASFLYWVALLEGEDLAYIASKLAKRRASGP